MGNNSQGGQGIVYNAKSDAGVFALKVLSLQHFSTSQKQRLRNEIKLCRDDIHPYVIKILDYGIIEEEDKIFYVMPKYESTFRKLLSEEGQFDVKISVFNKVLEALHAVHNIDVAHRDIKPENILYDPSTQTPVVCDFGIAHICEELMITDVVTKKERLANFPYASPEQREKGATKDFRCDIFALGLILNEIFTGVLPHGTNPRKIGDIVPEYSKLDEIVDVMLRQNPEERPQSCREILDFINL